MGEIRDKVTISYKDSVETEALFDSGASLSIVDEDVAKKAGMVIGDIAQESILVDGSRVRYKLALGMIEVKGCKSPLYAGVLVGAKPIVSCLIGNTQMELMGITLNPEKKSYTVKCRLPRL